VPSRRLWWSFVLWNSGAALSALFIDAFLWHRTASLPLVVSYQASFFVGMLLAFTACRAMSVTRMNLAAASAFLLTVAMGWVALFQALAVRFPTPLGLVTGLAYGLFYFAFYHALQYATTESHDLLSSRTGLWEAAIWLAGPPLAGLWLNVAGASGYGALFAVSAVVFAVAALIAPAAPPLFCPLPTPARPDESSPWRWLLGGLTLVGLREGALALLPALWLFVITGQPWLLGLYGAAVAASEASGYLFGRTLTPSIRREVLLTSSSALALAGVVILVWAGPQPWSLIAFGTVEGAASACLRSVAEASSLDLIGSRRSGATFAVSTKEQALNGGRLAAVLFLLAVVSASHLTMALSYLAWLSLLAVPAALVLRDRHGTVQAAP